MKMGTDQSGVNFCLSGRRLVILLLAWLSLLACINAIPVESHEAFVLQTAREMEANGDWVVPFFNQQPRLTKPPLSYWLTVGISRLDPFSADIEPWHGRFCSALAGLLLLLMTAYTGKKLYGGRTGFLAALLLMATEGFTEFSHNARPDFLYEVLCVLQLFAWIGAWRSEDGSSVQRLRAGLGWGLAGLATLTKGPQVPAVFLAGFLLFLLCGTGRRRILKVLRPFSGVMIWLALALPWWLLLRHRLQTMGVNIAETQLSGSLLQTLAGWKELFSFYYIIHSFISLLPVSMIIPVLIFWGCRKFEKPGAASRLLLCVSAIMLTVFTVGGHYRSHYMIPLFPLFVLLLAAAMDSAAAGRRLHRKIWWILFSAGTAALAVCAVLLILQRQYMTVLLLAGSGTALILPVRKELREPVWHNHRFSAQMLIASLLTVWLFAGFNALPSRNAERSWKRDFALAAGREVDAGDLLVAWGEFSDTLPYYSRRPVVPVNGSDELRSRFEQKSAGQDIYIVIPEKQLSALDGIFDSAVLGTEENRRKPDEILLLVKILRIRQ